MSPKSETGDKRRRKGSAGTRDQRRVRAVESALTESNQLVHWWDGVSHLVEPGRSDDSSELDVFTLFPEYPGIREIRGFFGKAELGDRKVPVMGYQAEHFFDQARASRGSTGGVVKWMAEQVHGYACNYWLRSRVALTPQRASPSGSSPLPGYLNDLSWCPSRHRQKSGLKLEQLRYSPLGSKGSKEFPEELRTKITTMDELKKRFSWVTMNGRLFNFHIDFTPPNAESPKLRIPLDRKLRCVMSSRLNETGDWVEPAGAVASYGPTLALLNHPRDHLITYGADTMQPGLMRQHLTVYENGEIWCRILMIMTRPESLLGFSSNPFSWGVRMADLGTLGLASGFFSRLSDHLATDHGGLRRIHPIDDASRALAFFDQDPHLFRVITSEALAKEILIKSVTETRRMILASQQIWTQVPDWTDPSLIPEWVITGRPANLSDQAEEKDTD